MANFSEAPQSGIYVAIKSIFTALRNDAILSKYLYYPSTDMNDDPTSKDDVTAVQKDLIFFNTLVTDDLEENQENKIGRLMYGLGNISKTYNNHMADKPYFYIYIIVPIEGFQLIDFRLEAIIDRINRLISNKKFTGSFGRVVKDGGNRLSVPSGYIGYTLKYSFYDTD